MDDIFQQKYPQTPPNITTPTLSIIEFMLNIRFDKCLVLEKVDHKKWLKWKM
jgi:hypothetical protein